MIKIKIIAYIYKNGNFQLVTIDQAIYSRENYPLEYKNTTYYYDPSFDYPVTPVDRDGTIYFRYNDSTLEFSSPKDGNSETVEHQLLKKYILSLKTICFNMPNKNNLIFNNCTCTSGKIIHANNSIIRADIYVTFETCNYAEYNKAWNNNFIIEINVTSKIDDAKKYNLRAENQATIEFTPNDTFKSKIRELVGDKPTSYSINAALNYIKNAISKNNILGSNIIVDPMSDSIFINRIKHYQSQLDEKNKELISYEHKYNLLNDEYHKTTSNLDKCIKIINALKDDIAIKNTQIDNFNKSLFYKLYKLFTH